MKVGFHTLEPRRSWRNRNSRKNSMSCFEFPVPGGRQSGLSFRRLLLGPRSAAACWSAICPPSFGPLNLFSLNAAPFDARYRPFSGTARASEAMRPSEPIPRIRRQAREVTWGSNPQKRSHHCPLAWLGIGAMGNAEEVPRIDCGGLANAGQKLDL